MIYDTKDKTSHTKIFVKKAQVNRKKNYTAQKRLYHTNSSEPKVTPSCNDLFWENAHMERRHLELAPAKNNPDSIWPHTWWLD
jgi:hypothetical protein